MALSFEESKKLLANQVAAASMSISVDPVVADPGIMTLDSFDDSGLIAAYSEWTKSDKYDWYDEYTDDRISRVDEKKNISVDSSQINISQEENSQYIPFEMPRYYDGFDLMNSDLWFFYMSSDGIIGSTRAINVSYDTSTIRLGWLVDAKATHIAGDLSFEIRGIGVNSKGNAYVWKSKPFDGMTVLQSIIDDRIIELDDTWMQELATKVAESVADQIVKVEVADQIEAAQNAAERAETAANNAQNAIATELNNYYDKDDIHTYVKNQIDAIPEVDLSDYALKDEIPTAISELTNDAGYLTEHQSLEDYATKKNLQDAIDAIDVTDQLGDYALKADIGDMNDAEGNARTVKQYVDDSVAAIDVSDQLGDLSDGEGNERTVKQYVDDSVAAVDVSSQLVDYAKSADVYTKTEVDNKDSALSSSIGTNTSNIVSLSTTVGELQTQVNAIDTSPRLTYDVAYDDEEDPDVGKNVFVLYEISNEGKENEVRDAKKKFVITGGAGSGGSSSLKIAYVTTSPVIATVNDKMIIKYNFSGTDSSGDIVSEGNYVWKIGSKVIASGIATHGENEFDVTDFATTTSQKFVLQITDDAGSLATKSWTVQKVDLRLESTFSDAYGYQNNVAFNYTPYGSIQKDIHFILDGEELGVVQTNTSGIPASYNIPAQSHGSHLLEVYMTATINNILVESNHIYKDILWQDADNNIPIIGCATQTIEAVQYNTINIKYAVLDPNTETPRVTWSIGDNIISEETLTEKDAYGYYTFSYKANDFGSFVLVVSCGDAEPKRITINVEKLNINVSPVTAGLEFDFNPVGYSNSSADRLWTNNNVTMTVSDNFDWVNGGYQIDENGDQYFCVKAGTNAVINYNLFADDPKKNGKEFKVIFRTKNIRKRDTSFLKCVDDNIGLDMKVEHATVSNSGGVLKSDYCEDTIIEYEFNINKDTDMMIVMSYEDGAPSKPYEYTETSSFKQSSPKPITIGSADCDVHIYRMKAYSTSLTDTDIKNNFIADARNADEILARYNRNQIYTDGKLISTSASGDFNVDALMKAAPDLRYIFLEVPQFTNDKDNKIDGCTVYFRYPAGTRPHDNWTCTGVRHRGQGTSSNLYGYAGRNIDLCMDRDESLFTYVDEEGNTVESSTITLTDTSVPTDYLNIKVNIASSENANNAQLARRFNEYQPFLRYARKKDSKVKDTMEFYNCVVFIRETSTDLSNTPHREFNDTDWHFYALGNVGDSKKTDDTRVNNKRDPKEHIIEITDADKPLSAFPTGKDGHAICPVNEWKSGNTAYDILHSNEYVYDEEGAFESFGGKTYEFRYEMKNITEEQREANINAWRDLYKFIVTSTNEEFHANLKNYFVVDSALYFYLFTERYTMVDNRAKNSFWHYGKVYISEVEAIELGETEASYYIVDNEMAAINDGYRYDLTMGYDMDTALGIDNTGDYVFSYGKEDTDYYVDGDPTSDYVFRVADSVFFCRLRDLFPSEMQAMYKNREEKNAWSSTSLINQWDNSQAQFPEELWRLDYERKYYRTYLGLSIDNSINTGEGRGVDKSFLIGKFFGRKKYSRRAFEPNQEIYFATKYFGNKALSDVFWIRGNVPIGGSIKPNYSLTLVPYSDMYVCVQYTSTGTPIHKKVKAGQTCYFESTADRMDFIYVYAASYIQEVGDLSRCFVGDNNFSSATRLQRLTIGSTDEGYENTFMKEVLVSNNPLLEYLDLRKISGINTVINVSSCSNLKELYAEGTNATGVIFANGGLLHTAHLPSLTSISMKNLNYIEDFVVDGYDKLQTLIVENVPNINTYNIVTNAPSLKLLRLINLNWDFTPRIENASIFNRLMSIGGIDSSGYEIDLSVLTGIASVALIGEYNLHQYKIAWPDLTIEATTIKPQFKVTFVNDDGTILDTQYIEQFDSAVDPITRDENPIPTPKKDSTIQYNYTFSGWSGSLANIVADRVIRALYSESIREYTIKYVVNGEPVKTARGVYGTNIVYDGNIPVWTAEEPFAFYLFNRWDKSGLLDGGFDDNGVKTVNAVFDKFTYSATAFNGKHLCDLTPVEIYAMNKLGLTKDIIPEDAPNGYNCYTINVGNDVEYDDIESELLVDNKTYVGAGSNYGKSTVFNGSNYIDTGIQLFDVDRDFVIALDYEFNTFDSSKEKAPVLAQCYKNNGNIGFKLWYNSGVQFTWSSSAPNEAVAGLNDREMVIIRHKKGDTKLTVYNSNLDGTSILMYSLDSKEFTSDATLVFGCEKQSATVFNHYAVGKIHWAKIWYNDLGDSVCKSLATWIHERITLEMSGFHRYYLSDNPDEMCNFSLLTTHLLGRTEQWNNSTTNDGGWAKSTLNTKLNNRLYNAMPTNIKLLMKRMVVKSNDGMGTSMPYYTDITSSNCYITIPSLFDVDPGKSMEPYSSETVQGTISFMGTSADRKRAFDGGDYNDYWLRSPYTSTTTSGSTWANYVWRIDNKGDSQGVSAATNQYGVVIEISF